MRFLLVALLLGSCNSDLYVMQHCEACRAEGAMVSNRIHFRKQCDVSCKPAPGVADTASDDPKAWKCGCLMPEKAP